MSRTVLSGLLAGIGAVAVVAAIAPASAQQGQQKFAIIDVQRIVGESASARAALTKLQDYGKEQEAKLGGKKSEIDQLKKRIDDGANALAEDRLNELKRELQAKTIELQRAGDDAQREFNERQAEALRDIERRVMPVIQQVGKEGGYSMIFRKFDSGLVYADESLDITALVIQRLDAAAAAPAPAKPGS